MRAAGQATLKSLKIFNMTASSVLEGNAAAANSSPSREKPSFATPTMDLVGEEARSVDPRVEKRVLRKIDLFLMPAMVIGKIAKIIT